MTRALVVGSGAREHAIAWKLGQSPRLEGLWIAPGNGGTAAVAETVPVPANDVEGIVRAARERHVDFAIVGPEEPLALGLADALAKAGIACLGPTRAAAQIEASKSFAKGLMDRAKIPTPPWQAFEDYDAARDCVESHPLPVVIKADGLAAGKGVAVCYTLAEAQAFLRSVMTERAFGAAGERVVIEECLTGTEASAFALSDGERILPTAPACDYKRAFDGDQGPNTGGMGSYSPPEFLDDRALHWVRERILRAAVRQMAKEGRTYRGILYAGLMVTPRGPRVLEFNCRMGDPEAQAVLPRLQSDLLSVTQAAATGSLAGARLDWSPRACVAVVLASAGYPGDYRRGLPISGLEEVERGVLVFHAGTRRSADGHLVTNGGRVLTVAALGATIAEARERAYANAARIRFEGVHYRRDIALRAVAATQRT